MKITEIVLPGVGAPDTLQVRSRELAAPGPGQAVVRVEATGISFAEQSMRRGRYPGQPAFPFVPGYDLVGTVTATGPGVTTPVAGQRVAAMTKTGGWATHALVPAADLVAVPVGVEAADAETVVVNGLTAWQMLHRSAKVRAGQTILVHGANGGVGTTLVQLAHHAGVRVIGTSTPRHHQALRDLGVEPVDRTDPELEARVRELAPGGVDAVFDHVGGPLLAVSHRLLAPRGTLVSYAISAGRDSSESMVAGFVVHLARLGWWTVLPDRRRATFYNVWAGHRIRPAAFRARLHEDLTTVLGLLADGVVKAQVAARRPLTEAAAAMELAESGTVTGKVVLIP